MDSKKIIALLLILLAFGAGFYVYQAKKQDKTLSAHNDKKYKELSVAAQKSSSAGMLDMAMAINNYHKANGRYPKTLLELHPTYIPDRGFITSLGWEYKPENKTYLVKRSVKGQNSFVSIGPDLRLQKGRTGITAPAQKVASSSKDQSQKTSIASKKDSPQSRQIKTTFIAPKKDLLSQKQEERKKTSEPDVQIIKKELGKNEKFLLSLSNANFYIWKTKDGIIGFSNIQYPDEKQLTIFRNESWVEYAVSKPSSSKK